MKKVIKFAAIMAATVFAFGFTACSDDDDSAFSESNNTQQGNEGDEIKTYLLGDYAVIGNNFDETTTYIFSRAKGKRHTVSLSDKKMPDGVKYLFMDWDSLSLLASSSGAWSVPVLNKLYSWTQNGVTLVLHKPESFSVFTIDLYIEDKLAGNGYSDDGSPATGSDSVSPEAKEFWEKYGEFEYDLMAIKPDGSLYTLDDVYKPGATFTTPVHSITTASDEK